MTSDCLAKLNGMVERVMGPTASPGSVAKNALVMAVGKSSKVANNNRYLMQDIRPKWRFDCFIIFVFSDDLIDI